jgi:hypothetical protein
VPQSPSQDVAHRERSAYLLRQSGYFSAPFIRLRIKGGAR